METWFTSGETGEDSGSKRPIRLYQMDGYQAEFSSREERSAGIAVYVKNGINYKVLGKSNEEVSFVHMEVSPGSEKDNYFFTCIYMPKFRDYSKLFQTLENIITSVQNKKTHDSRGLQYRYSCSGLTSIELCQPFKFIQLHYCK